MKFRFNVSFDLEVDPDPTKQYELYGTTVPEDMLNIDMINFSDDPGSLIEVMTEKSLTITGHIIEDDDEG